MAWTWNTSPDIRVRMEVEVTLSGTWPDIREAFSRLECILLEEREKWVGIKVVGPPVISIITTTLDS